jgi:hypothetical protein
MIFRPIELLWLGIMALAPVMLLLAAALEMRSPPWLALPVRARVLYSCGMAAVYLGLIGGLVFFFMIKNG